MNDQVIEEDETKPLWRYVLKLSKTPGGGNNYVILCLYIYNVVDIIVMSG